MINGTLAFCTWRLEKTSHLLGASIQFGHGTRGGTEGLFQLGIKVSGDTVGQT